MNQRKLTWQRFFLFIFVILMPVQKGVLPAALPEPPPGELVLHENELGRSNDSGLVKVSIARSIGTNGIKLVFFGGASLILPSRGHVLTNLAATNIMLNVVSNRLCVAGTSFASSTLILKPQAGFFRCQGIRYRGDVIAQWSGREIAIINRIEIEEYLRGVLPHEVNPNWHPEALKAQAIAARSYVLSRASENRNFPQDVDNTVSSQVYKGTLGEKPSTDKAIDETRGLVLMHDGKIVVGFFHSSCGGATEDSGNVWSKTLPYLRGQASPWCLGTPHYSWVALIPASEAARLLGLGGSLLSIEIRNWTQTRRVRSLVVRSSSGKARIVTGAEFRRALGVNRVKSMLFTPRVRGPWVQLVGRGWGHGVGMCQWCASRMALQGMDAAQILAHFYRSTAILPWRIVWPLN